MCEIEYEEDYCDNNKVEFKPCPFCGGSVTVTRCDEEGNVCQTGRYYGLQHFAEESGLCPIAVYRENILGEQLYSSEAEAAEIWNLRALAKHLKDVHEEDTAHAYCRLLHSRRYVI